MKLKRIFVIAAMLLIGAASESFAFRGPIIPIPIPVPVGPAPMEYGAPEVVAVPFFYEGFWWYNDGGGWYRSHHRNGPWRDHYRGRVPSGVAHYSHGGHGGSHGGHPSAHGGHAGTSNHPSSAGHTGGHAGTASHSGSGSHSSHSGHDDKHQH